MHAWLRFARPRGLLATAAALGLASAGSVVLLAGTASAHENLVSGIASCQSDGTYTITWTIANDYNLSETATLTVEAGGGTVSPNSVPIAASPSQPYQTGTAVQAGVAGSSHVAEIDVHGVWSDGYGSKKNDLGAYATGSVWLQGTCRPSAPATPTPTPPTCSADGSLTLTNSAEVHWYYYSTSSHSYVPIGNGDASSRTFGPGTWYLHATAQHGTFSDGHTTESYTVTVASQLSGTACATPVTPAPPTPVQSGCDGPTPYAGSITIPTTTGVIYEVNGDTTDASGTTITTPGTYSIVAVAAPGYTLSGTASWSLTIDTTPTSCPSQQSGVTHTLTCNSVTFTFSNTTVPSPSPSSSPTEETEVVLPIGSSITYLVFLNGSQIDSVTVAPGGTATNTYSGAGTYTVEIEGVEGTQDSATVSGGCVTYVPPSTPQVIAANGSVATTCPATGTGSYSVTLNNGSTIASLLFKVFADSKVVYTSPTAVPAGASYTFTNALILGTPVAVTAQFSSDSGATWSAIALGGVSPALCSAVLGEQVTKPVVAPVVATKPTSTSTQVLPFTGAPIAPLVAFGLALIAGGAMLVVASRRRRITQV